MAGELLPNQQELGVYTLQVNTDGVVTQFQFHNALDAVHSYDKFVDHGDAKKLRTITLVEPNLRTHIKLFESK